MRYSCLVICLLLSTQLIAQEQGAPSQNAANNQSADQKSQGDNPAAIMGGVASTLAGVGGMAALGGLGYVGLKAGQAIRKNGQKTGGEEIKYNHSNGFIFDKDTKAPLVFTMTEGKLALIQDRQNVQGEVYYARQSKQGFELVNAQTKETKSIALSDVANYTVFSQAVTQHAEPAQNAVVKTAVEAVMDKVKVEERINPFVEKTLREVGATRDRALAEANKAFQNFGDRQEKVMGALDKVVGTVDKVVETVDNVSGTVEEVSQVAKSSVGKVDRILTNVEGTTRNINAATDEAQKLTKNISPKVQELVEHIQSVTGTDLLKLLDKNTHQQIQTAVNTVKTPMELMLVFKDQEHKLHEELINRGEFSRNEITEFQQFRTEGIKSRVYDTLALPAKAEFRKKYLQYEWYHAQLGSAFEKKAETFSGDKDVSGLKAELQTRRENFDKIAKTAEAAPISAKLVDLKLQLVKYQVPTAELFEKAVKDFPKAKNINTAEYQHAKLFETIAQHGVTDTVREQISNIKDHALPAETQKHIFNEVTASWLHNTLRKNTSEPANLTESWNKEIPTQVHNLSSESNPGVSILQNNHAALRQVARSLPESMQADFKNVLTLSYHTVEKGETIKQELHGKIGQFLDKHENTLKGDNGKLHPAVEHLQKIRDAVK